jgi:hypothetical protein
MLRAFLIVPAVDHPSPRPHMNHTATDARRVSGSADARLGRTFDAGFSVLMGAMIVLAAATAADYGISVDEFLFDTYGGKALDYYRTWGADRSLFEWYDNYLYGPWFQMVVAALQSFDLMAPFDMRHLATGLLSLIGLCGVYWTGAVVFNRRVAFVAVCLLLLSGNYYGHMFNSPIDAPYLVAMTFATLGIVLAFRGRPRRFLARALLVGVLVGWAAATRVGGIMLLAYVGVAAGLAVIDRWGVSPEARPGERDGVTLTGAIASVVLIVAVAAAVTWAAWPWLHEDTIARLKGALGHFGKIEMDYTSLVWGVPFRTTALPWYYIPLNLIARLAEPFTVLLGLGLVFAALGAARGMAEATVWRDGAVLAARRVLGIAARERGAVIVAFAALFPLLYIVATGAVLYDGIRHVLFTAPMLALLAARAAEPLWPWFARVRLPAALALGALVGYGVWAVATLHPNEYIRISAFAGGTRYGAPRFESDYWGTAVGEGIERLREYLDLEARNGRPVESPRVLIGISYRENLAAPYLPKGWTHVDTKEAAQFAVAPTRWQWQPPEWAHPIAEVVRQGIVLAVVYDMRRE